MDLATTLRTLKERGATPDEIEAVRFDFTGGNSIQLEPKQERWSPDRLKSVLDQLDAKGATQEEKDEVIKAAGGTGSISSYEPTLRDRMGAAVQDVASSLGLSNQASGNLAKGLTGSSGVGTEQMGLVDLVPGPSNVLAHQDAQRDFDKGSVVGGVLNEVAAALPAGKVATNAFKPMVGPTPPPRLSEKAAEFGIPIPRAMDPNPDFLSRTTSDLAGRASGIPIIGNPLAEKVHKGRAAIDERVTQAIQKSGPETSTEIAGDRIGDAARDWMRTTTKDEVGAAYKAVENLLPKNFRSKMPELAKVARTLQLEDAAAFSTANRPVFDAIQDALASPHGITIDGAERLRQLLSKQANPGLAISDNATAQPAFKRAAGALAKDVEKMISAAGGGRAVRAAADAKRIFRKHKKTRDAIEIFLGKGARQDMQGASGEKVISKIHTAAKDGGGGDSIALIKLRQAVDAESWEGMRRALNEKMGRDASGEFNPLKWSKEFHKLSARGKRILYGKQLAQEYIGLTGVLTSYVKAASRIGNPSRSGDLVAGMGLGASVLADGGLTLLGMLKARWWMNYMGNPRVVRAATRYMKAKRSALNSNAAPTAVRLAARHLAVQVEKAGGDAQEVMRSLSE